MRSSRGARLGLVFVLVLSNIFVLDPSPTVHAATQEPATFFLHKQSSKTINTINSNLWSNTTRFWSPGTQTENRTISTLIPGTWDFYTQPALAGNVTLAGLLNSTLYLSVSLTAGPGAVLNETISKISRTGKSTPIASVLTSANIGTKPRPFSLIGTSSTVQLEAGSILDFTITVTVSGPIPFGLMISLYYDSSTYPSQVLLTFQSRVGATSFQTYDQAGDKTSSFSRNATFRQITLLAALFDALGTYDIATVVAKVSSPSGSQVFTNINLTQVKGAGSDYDGTWELNYTYSTNDPSGTYTSSLLLLDNDGFSVIGTLSYTLFAEWMLNVQTVTQDSSPIPIPGVTMFVYTSAEKLVYFGISNASGWIPSGLLLPDDTSYTIRSYWEGQWLSQIGPYAPTGASSITLSISVYQVSFSNTFRDWNGDPLPHTPAGFQLLSPNGSVTRPNFSATYLLPEGAYQISQVLWEGQDVTSSTVSFNPKGGAPTINLQLYDLTIFVVDQNSRPLSTATVTLFQASQVIEEGTTGDQGTFTIHDLTKGEYTAVVQTTQILQPVASKVSLVETSTTTIQVSTSSSPTVGLNQSYLWMLLAGGILVALVVSLKFSRRRFGRELAKKKS